MKRRILSLLMAVVMIYIMTGCGSNGTVDAAQVFAYSQEKAGAVKSVDAIASLKLSMSSGGENVDMDMDMKMSVFNDPIKAKVNMNMAMGELGSQNSDIYMISEDGKFYTYTGMDGTWYKQEMDQALFEQSISGYDSSAYLDALVECAENFTMEKVDEDGKKLYKVEGEVSGDSMQKIMDSMQGMDQLETLTQGDFSFTDMGSLSMTVYIDQGTYMIDKMSIDLTDMMQEVMASVMEEAGSDENVTINTYVMDIEYTSYDSSEDFDLPEEAKNAEEIDMSMFEE